MELVFNHIDEKDIDMLVMSRLSCGGLLDLFIGELGGEISGNPKGYELVKVQHSATTRNGESDLVAVLSGPSDKHAVLIEDKVDALYRIDDWEDATADAALIVDTLYKVQRLYDYAIDLNGRQADLRVPAVE